MALKLVLPAKESQNTLKITLKNEGIYKLQLEVKREGLKYACPALPLWVFGYGLGLGDFVWNERAVAFERVVDEITRRHTARY